MPWNDIPGDVLIYISLFLPLNSAVLLPKVSRATWAKLDQDHSFWASLFLEHRHLRAFRCPRYQDISSYTLDTLKDTIFDSLRVEHADLTQAPVICNTLTLSGTEDVMYDTDNLGGIDEWYILLYVPGTSLVVLASTSRASISCWDRQTGTVQSILHNADDLVWGFESSIVASVRMYDTPGKLYFSLSHLSRDGLAIFTLDYGFDRAKLTYLFSIHDMVGFDPEVGCICLGPRTALFVWNVREEEWHIRTVDLSTRSSTTFYASMPEPSCAPASRDVAAQVIDGYLQVVFKRRDGAKLFVCTEPVEEWNSLVQEDGGTEQPRPALSFQNGWPSQQNAAKVLPNMLLGDIRISPFASRIIAGNLVDDPATVTMWDGSHLPFPRKHKDDGQLAAIGGGSFGVDIRHVRVKSATFEQVTKAVRPSYWFGTAVVHSKHYGLKTIDLQLIRFMEGPVIPAGSEATTFPSAYAAQLVLPGVLRLDRITSVCFDDSAGVLMVTQGSKLYCLEWMS